MATILVVDDDPMVRGLAAKILEAAGHQVVQASNGLQGLLVYESYASRIDIVLTDVDMPQLNGVEMAHRIRATHPDSKVVFMSGGIPASVAALPASCAFVSKPFRAAGLVSAVEEAIGGADRGPRAR